MHPQRSCCFLFETGQVSHDFLLGLVCLSGLVPPPGATWMSLQRLSEEAYLFSEHLDLGSRGSLQLDKSPTESAVPKQKLMNEKLKSSNPLNNRYLVGYTKISSVRFFAFLDCQFHLFVFSSLCSSSISSREFSQSNCRNLPFGFPTLCFGVFEHSEHISSRLECSDVDTSDSEKRA